MVCRLVGAKPLSELMLACYKFGPGNKFQWNFKCNLYIFIKENAFENIEISWDMHQALLC